MRIALAKEQRPVRALLFEIMTQSTGEGLSYSFLMKIQEFAQKNSILIVVDETATSLRSWEPFFFLHYPKFRPDFVTIGKAWKMCGLLAVNKSKEDITSYRKWFPKTSTCLLEPLTLQKSLFVFKTLIEEKAFQRAIEIDELILEFAQQHPKCNAKGLGTYWIFEQKIQDLFMPFGRALFPPLVPISALKEVLALAKFESLGGEEETVTYRNLSRHYSSDLLGRPVALPERFTRRRFPCSGKRKHPETLIGETRPDSQPIEKTTKRGLIEKDTMQAK
jgi:hypothetical protein